MKKLFTVFVLLFVLTNTYAQYVTINDTNFLSWLQANVPSAMNGNQMDTTSLSVTTRTIVDVNYKSISSIDGIQYFKSLKSLDCSTNNITILNNLPNTLVNFNCNYNYLSSLPNLPNTLETLFCSNNELTSLPTLPNTLKILVCNKVFPPFLIALPNLPPLLDTLEIEGHGLNSLPALPLSLKKLSYYRNNVANIPALPPMLLYLNCGLNNIVGVTPTFPLSLVKLNLSSNSISNLTSLPPNLEELMCGVNQLASLPAFPATLKYFDCQVNHITTLPMLPNSLEYLVCWQNLLTSLPTLPNTIKTLNCSNNNLISLPILPDSLGSLNCSSNQILSLPTLPPSLSILIVSSNSISVLPPLPNSLVSLIFSNNNISMINSIPNNIIDFDCSSNQLTSLPNLPPFLEGIQCHHNNINCFPSFPNSIHYFNILNNPFTCLPNYSSFMDAATLAYPICAQSNTVTNPNSCTVFQGIQGTTYNDQDNNCIKTTDQYATNISLKLYDNLNTLLSSSYTFGTGIYNFAVSTGTYNVVIDTIYRPYKVICSYPGIDTLVTLSSSLTTASDVNFPVNCKSGFDVGVQSVLVNGFAFPGQTHTLSIVAGDMSKWYNMNCAMGVSGTVAFTINGPVTYIGAASGALTPSVTGNTYSYFISDFGAISNSNSFQLVFSTDTIAQLGDNICITATVTPTSGDNDNSNNIYNYCYVVSNSHDPNKKDVYPINVSPNFHDWLTYTIHFQNTGNAPAINIRIADTLNTNLDVSTFQVINYSHINQVDVIGNILNVRFPNIQLPDSTGNSVGSQGFVQYRIKPKANLPAGTKISNTAYIYFDFNSPIITNTTINNFVIDLSVNEANLNANVLVYPNPTNGSFDIETSSIESKNLQILDITGNIVFEKTIDELKNTINTSNLANGIYTLKISGSNCIATKKLVIVK